MGVSPERNRLARFALLVFQWDYTTVYAISFLFGVVACFAAANEFMHIAISTTGWKIVHGILGVLFVIAGVWAFAHPHTAFSTLAAVIGFFILFKDLFDLTVSFMTRKLFDLWWLQLIIGILEIALAFWVAGLFPTECDPPGRLRRDHRADTRHHRFFLAFKLKGLSRRTESPM